MTFDPCYFSNEYDLFLGVYIVCLAIFTVCEISIAIEARKGRNG